MGKVTIILPDELEIELKSSAEKNTRTLTQEVLHRIKLGTEKVGWKEFEFVEKERVVPNETPLISQPNWNTAPLGGDYSEIIEFIERVSDEGYQGTPEDGGKLRELERKYGVKWNTYKGVLEKQTKDGWIVVWKK